MPKREPITIAGETFATQKALKERIRAIVAAYPDFTPLGPADFTFVRALLERHRGCVWKVGCGVASIEIQPNWMPGERGFWLTRTDGSRTDFSWRTCVDTSDHHRRDVQDALRAIVFTQVQDFRAKWFATHEWTCPLRGTPITPETCDVDHVPPDTFADLVTRFLAERELTVEGIAVIKHRDGDMVRRLVDRKLDLAWWKFHRDHARLRVISRHTHQTLPRRAPETP